LDRSTRGTSLSDLPPAPLPQEEERRPERPRITVIDYDEYHYHEAEVKDVSECFVFKEKPTVTWINIDGLQSTSWKLGLAGIHPLCWKTFSPTGGRRLEYSTHILVSR
jgi:magnesium transporter